MARYAFLAVWLVVGLVAVPAVSGQEPAAKPQPGPRAKVEFRWLEAKAIKGVTQEKGIRTTCGDALSYPHAKPVLTQADVVGTQLTAEEFKNMAVPATYYSVKFQFSKEAKKKLVESCGSDAWRVLGIFVDGEYMSAWKFEKAKADTFVPFAGMFSTKPEAERVVEGCKPQA
jgi:hypothetical protein